MGEKGGLPGQKGSLGSRVRGEWGYRQGHRVVETHSWGQECVQCWVALGPCAAEYVEYSWDHWWPGPGGVVAVGQLYPGYSGASHWVNGSVVARCTVCRFSGVLRPRTLHCLGWQIDQGAWGYSCKMLEWR